VGIMTRVPFAMFLVAHRAVHAPVWLVPYAVGA
jgi:hypothetical protein